MKTIPAILLSALISVATTTTTTHAALDAERLALEDEAVWLNDYVEGWDRLNLVSHVFPPFQYKKNGEIVGPLVEIMRRICVEASLNCRLHMHAWRQAYADALSGESDLMFSFLLSPDDRERSELFKYSPNIVQTTHSFYVSSTSNWKWTGKIEDLDDRTIGVYGPNSGTYIIARDLLAQNKTAKMVIEETNLKAFQQLIIGKYGSKAAIVSNRDTAEALLKDANIFGPKIAGDIKTVFFGFGFNRKSPRQDLYNRMSAATQVLKDKGVIAKILKNAGLVPAP